MTGAPSPSQPVPGGRSHAALRGRAVPDGDGERSVWPGRRRFPAPRWPGARLRNEPPCTTPCAGSSHSHLPGIKPQCTAARSYPGQPSEQVSGLAASTRGGGGSPCLGVPPPPLCSHAWLCHDLLLEQGRSHLRDMSRQLSASQGAFLAPTQKERKPPPESKS